VNAAGGPCTPVTKVRPNTRHGGPEFLPDGKHFFYVVQAPEQAESGIYLAALDDPAGRRLLADQSSVLYTPPALGSRVSHLLFLRENVLMAQPFDAAALELAGDPFPLVAQASSIGTPMLLPTASVAGNGVLVYLANQSLDRQLAWFDRSGKELGQVGARSRRRGVTLSPDGKAASSSLPDGVWLLDLPRGVETHLTQATQVFSGVVWSPDGGRVVFTKNQDLYLKDPSGRGVEELLLQSGHVKSASDWSRDGRFLLYTDQDPKTRSDIWYLPDPLKPGSKQPVKFLATESNEGEPQFSPDGKWVAYFSNESGNDVYVRPFPSGAGQWRVSTNTGRDPRWSRDGKELFYLEYSGPFARVMAVPVRLGPGGTPEFGVPRKLFEYRGFGLGFTPLSNSFAYSPSPDGQRFLVNRDADTAEPVINVITNWQKAAVASAKEQ
jgi:Tol biopolymer transport system component